MCLVASLFYSAATSFDGVFGEYDKMILATTGFAGSMAWRYLIWRLYYEFGRLETVFRWTVSYGWILGVTDVANIIAAYTEDPGLAIWVLAASVIAERKFW